MSWDTTPEPQRLNGGPSTGQTEVGRREIGTLPDTEIPVQDRQADSMACILREAREQKLAARQIIAVGIGGDPSPSPSSLRAVLAANGTSLYTLFALSIFAALDQGTAYVISAEGPDISNSLGVSPSSFAMIATQRSTLVGLLALQFAALFYKREQRALLSRRFAFQYGPALLIGSFVTWIPAMTLVIGVAGASAAVVYAAHRPMIMDSTPPSARLRALCIHTGAAALGGISGLLLIALLSGPCGLTWRGVFLVVGVLFIPISLLGRKLTEPAYGRFDSDRIAGLMHGGDGPPTTQGDPSGLKFQEAVRRVWLIPTVRRMLAVWAVLGVAVTPLVSYQGFWLEEQFNLTVGQRSMFLATGWILSLPTLYLVARYGESAWRRDPRLLIRIAAGSVGALAVGLVLAAVPVLAISFAGFSIVFAGENVAIATLSLVLLSVVRPRYRGIAAGLSALFFGLVGGEGGTLLLGSIATHYSAQAAILVLVVPALGAALLMRRTTKVVQADLDVMAAEILEDEGVHDAQEHGGQLPLLSCQGIDYSYGQLQVLFGIDFTVREGEMLALLGVNGAGKSTLLKVISGICIPGAGSVRLNGRDITYLDAERRVGLGITQIPGGRAVFGSMTIVDNLRGFAYTLGRDRHLVDSAIDECFDVFPILGERRHQTAATLSGGEQQMLALSKAFILKPQLLLIDELSLGLAPKVVDMLLGMVKRINTEGTAVVLVEQSMSIALSCVDHAYFMEKGEVRFDGSSEELLGRDDLFRAVFLGSAAGGNSA